MNDSLRGRTFSPAKDWLDGGRAFAFRKLGQVEGFLLDLAQEAQRGGRRKRRRNTQRAYDLVDAARTVGDAKRLLRQDGVRKDDERLFDFVTGDAARTAITERISHFTLYRSAAGPIGGDEARSLTDLIVNDLLATTPRNVSPSDESADNPE